MSIKGQALADFRTEIPGQDKVTPGKETKHTKPDSQDETQGATETWILYTDGAASKEGSGAGLILQSPQGDEVTYALRFDFKTSNNEAEYEALLAGLRLATQMGAHNIQALCDSMLVTNQVNGKYDTKDIRMQQYAEAVKKLAGTFNKFEIKQISRGQNRRADALSKLASTSFEHLTKTVLVEVLPERSIHESAVNAVMQEEPTWTTPIRDYLTLGILPEDPEEARRIRIKAPQYAVREGDLYKRGYLAPWLKCVSKEVGQEVLADTHKGPASTHKGARALTGRILRMGIYWPDIYKDAAEVTKKCVECQTFAPIQNQPAVPLTNIASPWPFHQ